MTDNKVMTELECEEFFCNAIRLCTDGYKLAVSELENGN